MDNNALIKTLGLIAVTCVGAVGVLVFGLRGTDGQVTEQALGICQSLALGGAVALGGVHLVDVLASVLGTKQSAPSSPKPPATDPGGGSSAG